MTAWGWALPLVSGLLTWLLVPLVRRYAWHRELVDQPGARRSHDRPVPRGGGVAIVLAIVLALLLAVVAGPGQHAWVLMFGVGLLLSGALGWADDHGSLAVRWRLAGQLLIAVIAVAWLGPVEAIALGGHSLSAPLLWSALAVVAIIWLMNLFNFMDGSDGLAASQTLISALLFAAVFWFNGEQIASWLALLLATGSAAFLCWNWPPATIFLGDSGSLPLGWGVAALALMGTLSGTIGVIAAFIIVSPFVVDATLTLAWRLARGEQWYTPHRCHAYQRLLRSGWSHWQMLMVWWGINIVLVVPATLLVAIRPEMDLAVGVVVACVLGGLWFMAGKGFVMNG